MKSLKNKLIAPILATTLLATPSTGTNRYVPDNGSFNTVVNAAAPGDSVIIRKGNHLTTGPAIVQDKSIYIRGEEPDSSRIVAGVDGQDVIRFIETSANSTNTGVLENLVIDMNGLDGAPVSVAGWAHPTVRNMQFGNMSTNPSTYVVVSNQDTAPMYENVIMTNFINGFGAGGTSFASANGIIADPAGLIYTLPGSSVAFRNPNNRTLGTPTYRIISTSDSFQGSLTGVTIINPVGGGLNAFSPTTVDPLLYNTTISTSPGIDLLRIVNIGSFDSPCPWEYLDDPNNTVNRGRIVVDGDTLSSCGTSSVPTEQVPSGLELMLQSPARGHQNITLRNGTPSEAMTEVDIFSVDGKQVANGSRMPIASGQEYNLSWDGALPNGSRAPSGVYYVRGIAGSKQVSKPFIYLK